jgi:hypothetical protein
MVCYEKLGRHEEARETMRRLRATHPEVSLADIEMANSASFLPPDVASDMNATIRKVWEDTPVTA